MALKMDESQGAMLQVYKIKGKGDDVVLAFQIELREGEFNLLIWHFYLTFKLTIIELYLISPICPYFVFWFFDM